MFKHFNQMQRMTRLQQIFLFCCDIILSEEIQDIEMKAKNSHGAFGVHQVTNMDSSHKHGDQMTSFAATPGATYDEELERLRRLERIINGGKNEAF